jgi:hypothetical protein
MEILNSTGGGIYYGIISAQMHGSWLATFGTEISDSGQLDFRGYLDKDDLHHGAILLIGYATSAYVRIWNEIAEKLFVPKVNVPFDLSIRSYLYS